MRATRPSERGLTLSQLLVTLVACVIAVSLGLAFHHSRHAKPLPTALELPRAQ